VALAAGEICSPATIVDNFFKEAKNQWHCWKGIDDSSAFLTSILQKGDAMKSRSSARPFDSIHGAGDLNLRSYAFREINPSPFSPAIQSIRKMFFSHQRFVLIGRILL